MQNKTFTIKAKMWVWPGDMPWHFVSLDKDISKTVRENYPKSAMVKVRASIVSADGENVFTVNKKINEEEILFWDTSLFRNKKDENYIMPVKKDIRNKLGIFAGEVLEIKIEIL